MTERERWNGAGWAAVLGLLLVAGCEAEPPESVGDAALAVFDGPVDSLDT